MEKTFLVVEQRVVDECPCAGTELESIRYQEGALSCKTKNRPWENIPYQSVMMVVLKVVEKGCCCLEMDGYGAGRESLRDLQRRDDAYTSRWRQVLRRDWCTSKLRNRLNQHNFSFNADTRVQYTGITVYYFRYSILRIFPLR